MTIEEKYRRALLALRAIANRSVVSKKHPNEPNEAVAFRDCRETAFRCLSMLDEEIYYTKAPPPLLEENTVSAVQRIFQGHCKSCGRSSYIDGICDACGNKVEKALPKIKRIIIAKYKHGKQNSASKEEIASFAEMLIFHKTKVFVSVRCKPDNTFVVEPPKTE